jgi:ACS family tartrate transporter-like MFS transporter
MDLSPDTSAPPTDFTKDVAHRTRTRVTWRLIPFLVLLYIISFLDRVNVGYAKLRMTDELAFSDAVFGFGAGIFFVGYVLLEIPGTLLVERWSARLWFSRIMITWGIVAVMMGFIKNATQFYWLRFLLGLAEAGFYPGIIVYLAHWFRPEDRGRAIAFFMIGSPVANVIGAPLSGLIMEYVHWHGLAGWRWLFILQGLPAILVGILVPFVLPDRPEHAKWLPAEERDWLKNELAREAKQKQPESNNYWLALSEPAVLLLTVGYFFAMTGLYGLNMWLPTLLKSFSGLPILQVTFLSALPYLVALGIMLWVGWSSDRTGERIWHATIPLLCAGVAFFCSVLLKAHIVLSLVMLCVVAAGLWSFFPSFWALPSALLSGASAAVSIGLINSVGNLGGFAGPYIVGFISDKTHSYFGGVVCLAISLCLAGLFILALKSVRSIANTLKVRT